MKVFVLGYLSDPSDDTSSSDVIGVYKTKEEAQSVMRNDFNTSKDEYEITDEEIENFNAKLYEDEMHGVEGWWGEIELDAKPTKAA